MESDSIVYYPLRAEESAQPRPAQRDLVNVYGCKLSSITYSSKPAQAKQSKRPVLFLLENTNTDRFISPRHVRVPNAILFPDSCLFASRHVVCLRPYCM